MSSNGMSGMCSHDISRTDGQAVPSPSKGSNVQSKINKLIADDPASYSLQTTTVPEQANKEANFIGSAWFYNLSINQVRTSDVIAEYISDSQQ